MKINKYLQALLLMLITGLFSASAQAHGAVEEPISRVVKCYRDGGFWGAISGIPNQGCRDAASVLPNSFTYQFQQWNEVSKNVADYNTIESVKRLIPDGKLCAAADPQKAGLDVASPNWYRTLVKPVNGHIRVVWAATAPHTPNFFDYYLTKPGYNGSQPLKWSDLEHLETVPSVSPVNGKFTMEVKFPEGRSGNAVLYSRFQRIDPVGEGFYSCSDITIEGGGAPAFPWHEKGTFIPAQGFVPVPGEKVRFRVLGHTRNENEIVDHQLPITTANATPAAWGKELAKLLDRHDSAHVRIGVRNGANIQLNESDIKANQIWLANDKDQAFMSIIAAEGGGGGGTEPQPINPHPPTALINGSTTVTSGQPLSLNGSGSTGHNGALEYQWTTDWLSSNVVGPTLTVAAPAATAPKQHKIRLTVVDTANKTSAFAEKTITVNPAGGGTTPITATMTIPASVESGASFPIRADAMSATGKPLTYTWTKTSGMFTGTTGGTGSGTYTAAVVQQDTPATISVVISDGSYTLPKITKPITIKKAAPPTGGACGNVPAWSATKVYQTSGEQVAYKGKVYKQNFYNVNKEPDVNSAAYGLEWLPGTPCP